MNMITVQQAEDIILKINRPVITEDIPFEISEGRVLAEDIVADRDMPPYDRVTMDGIAIRFLAFEQGSRSFKVISTIAAGDMPTTIGSDDECVEIMTGAALPANVDTIIRYEDVVIAESIATLKVSTIKKGQNIHRKGSDRQRGDIVVRKGTIVDSSVISILASVGKSTVSVKRSPKIIVITTGDELVAVDEQPNPYQVRTSNSHTISSVLKQYGLHGDILHLADNEQIIFSAISRCMSEYDIILLSGGVSMGKFDILPCVLEKLSVQKLFHKVKQRPGKPFWFGATETVLVFAFPGNPVSTYLCLHRYFLPWINQALDAPLYKTSFAVLDDDVTFEPQLQYFIQVAVSASDEGLLHAKPIAGNGSGDFANLLDTNAFMELPLEQSKFTKGSVYKIWPFKHIV